MPTLRRLLHVSSPSPQLEGMLGRDQLLSEQDLIRLGVSRRVGIGPTGKVKRSSRVTVNGRLLRKVAIRGESKARHRW